MSLTITFCLIGASIIHLLPLWGVLGQDQLVVLYGIKLEDQNLLLLMRHRAILFGILGVAMLCAAFHSPIRSVTILLGLISTVSFLLLALGEQTYSSQIWQVMKADVVAIVLLAIAAVLHLLQYRESMG